VKRRDEGAVFCQNEVISSPEEDSVRGRYGEIRIRGGRKSQDSTFTNYTTRLGIDAQVWAEKGGRGPVGGE